MRFISCRFKSCHPHFFLVLSSSVLVGDSQVRVKIKTGLFVGLAILFIGLFFILFSPVFNIKKLVVSGNKFVSYQEVSDMINFKTDENIFLFNRLSAKRNLFKNYFVHEAKIKILLPDTISVDLQERDPCCYIKYLDNSFVLIDSTGFVIKCTKSYDEGFPFVDGLVFDNFTVGKQLDIKDKESFDTAIKISEAVLKNEISQRFIVIDISDMDDIYLHIDRLDIALGKPVDYQKKISILKSILDSNSPYLKKTGVLSLDSKVPIFKFIT